MRRRPIAPLRRRPLKIPRRHLTIARRRVLPPPAYTPEWRGTFEQWSRHWVRRNFWRVQRYLGSEEDALQECALIFVKCANRYRDKVDNAAWFMSLYTRAITNRWIRLSQNDTAERQTIVAFDEWHAAYEQLAGNTEAESPAPQITERCSFNEGPLQVALHELTDEMRQVLTAIMDAPSELLDSILAPRNRALVNQRLRRYCGLPWKPVDILRELRDLVTLT